MYKVGDIFYLDSEYSKRADFCNNNGLMIAEINPDENGRRFQIQEVPPITRDEIIQELRHRREIECFSVINRGVLWYNMLTEEQRLELDIWYKKWLDVTETMVIPEKPSWLED